MKNFNLIKRLWTDSHEKQSPQRFGRYAAMLIMLLTLGVGQMWADTGFYNCYFTYNDGSNHSQNQDASGMANKDLGTLSSNLTIKAAYLKVWDNNGSSSRKLNNGQFVYTKDNWSHKSYAGEGSWTLSTKDGNNYELQKSSVTWTLASLTEASGSYTLKYYWQAWGDGDKYLNNGGSNYQFTYKIAPPAVSGFTITPSGAGYVSGTGTEDDPYIMKHDAGNLVLTISGSQAHTDANSSAKYYTGSSWGNTTTKTIYYASGSTTKQSITLKMKYNNSTASLDGAVSERTVWYQRETAYNVRATANPSAGGNPTPSSLTATGQYSGISITAPANTGYTFSTWSIVSGGAGTFGSAATTASNTFYPTKATDLKATFTAKNYTVKLSKNGGDTDGTITTTYNSTSTASFTGATYAGHSCDGYFTAKSGGSKIVNADGTLASGSVASYLSSGNWVGDTVTILYAQWTEDVTNYTVTYGVKSDQTSLGTLSCATTTGSTPVSSGGEVASGTGVTFTASPITGYEVDAWCSDAACKSPIAGAGYANTYATTVSANTTVYVKFKKKIYSITYSPSSAPTGCTYTTKPTTGTYGNTVTMVITPSTGYTVSVSAVDASSSTVTISNPSANTYTFTQPASAVTVTVTTTETMSTLTTANSYDGANPSWSAPTKSVSSIGISTTATVTAHANDLGYTLTSWTITGGVRTDGGATNANPITVRSNGDGAAVSVTANYVGSNRSVNIYLPNTGNSWSTSDNNWRFYKLPGESGETVTLAVDIDKYDYSGSGYKLGFNIYHTDWTYKWWHNRSDYDTNMDAHNCTNWGFNTSDGDYKTNLDLNVSGTYTFTLTNSTTSSTQKLSVTYPDKSFIEGNFPTAWSEDAYTMTDNGTTETVTINITSTGDKEFRLVSHGKLFGTSTKITHAANSQTLSAKNMSDAGAVMTLAAYVTGNYTFSYNKSTKVLTVTWPVYNQVRISAASPTDATNTGNFDLGAAVSNVRTVTRSLNAGTTYTFKVVYDSEWYGKNSGAFTRSTSTSSNSETISADGGNMTLTTDYAGDYTFKFNQSTKALSVDFPAAYKITFGKGSVDGTTGSFSAVDLDNGSSAVTSNSTWVKSGDKVKITAPSAKSGYRFLGWYDNNSATGDAIETNANCTISVTAATTVYACYAENLTSITVSAGTGGTVTTGSGTSNLGVTTTKAINASANPGYTWSTWTISGTAALGTTATTASNTAKGNGTNGSTGTITATFTPNPYTITLEKHNGQSDGSINVTFDANTNLTGTAVTAPTKTGYTFGGYYTGESGAGTKIINADGTVVASASDASYTYTDASKNWKYPNNITLHAKWTAKTYTVTLDYDETNHGDITTTPPTGSVTATYDAAMPAIAILPKAAEGYAFMGYYSAAGGSGTQYYDGTGASITNWNVDDEITLYAYYKQAEITSVTFDDDVVEPGATVTATANIDPTPAGTTTVCWRLLHDNGNEYSPQPTFTPASGTTVSFTAPETSTHYKVEAKLRTGSSCGGGSVLDTDTVRFQVAGSHTVTVNYKCGDDVIKAATTVTATPLDWTEEFTAPDIFGYTFARWDAADGVTIKNGDSDPVTTTTEATIQIKATYNGKLTAVYTQKSMIFFKNTLGWSDVYVNFYTGSYWNNPKGSGNQSVTKRNLAMTQYGETDIWYYDYGAASITPSLYVSFTSESQDNTEFFWKAGGVNVVYPANYPDAINTDKSSENGFKAATPMFVPLATQDGVTLNQSSGGKADYYNAGYWTKYTPGTGYTLEIYNEAGNVKLKSVEFTSADELMPMKATVDLEGGTTYKFQLKRSGDIYYGNSGTMTYANHGSPTPWDMTNGSFSMCGIITNAAGDYTFNLSYSGNSSTPPHYRLRMAVDYPIADGDYRLIYKDAVHTLWHPSAIVSKGNNRKDTVSFFVRPGSSPEMKIQTASVNPSTGAVTWGSDVAIPTATLTGLTSTDVYNFNLSMDGSGNISLESVDTYTGNFYIRTDAANSKWDNYRNDPDHLMVYSEYSIEHGGYTHYHAHWVNKDDAGRKNVKFTIANDYSPCISDTLTRETAEGTWANIDDFMTTGGDLKRSANVRFMWDKRDNSISRAYVDGAQGDWSTNFLYMLNVEAGADKIRKTDESALSDHKITFKDNGNWMYEANIQAQPTAQIKLLSNWGTSNTITQYFRGGESSTETLLGGSGSNWYEIRVIYDFKTNRLIAGLIPSGEIDEQMAIHADVMFIREHQGDIAQLTFAEKGGKMGAITDIETAYGVLQFNKWTINNKSKEAGHAPLSPLLSRYERDLFYVSFPFRVSMEEVFGFGTYGTHWIIEYYDGANRAANGYWLESDPNWKFIWDRKGKYFEPGQGYIIALELDELGESSSVWANTDQVELYFPSYGSMDNITSSTATYAIPAHECTINRTVDASGNPTGLPATYDRRIRDSHWNVLGVPTYVNPNAPSYANTDWITAFGGPNFLYQVNWSDNSVSPVSSATFTYHAMHAYLVQYCGNVTWTSSVSVNPSAAPRRNPAYRGEYEFRLEMLQNDEAVDQTFVKLSDNEAVTTGFEFNYDLSKEFNKKKANIYTLIGTEQVAGNVLPLTEQTTVVPVGVQIKTNGEYTFSMPEGTAGIGVTLIDNETGLRTPLGLTDYTVTLEAGTYEDRFALEISPVKGTATGVEEVTGDGLQVGARKVMIDGILYIVKDGKVFDAHGNRVR